MSKEEIHLGDIGTVFTITLKEDDTAVNISTATTKQIIFLDPSQSATAKTAEFTDDGSNGKIYYTTIANDLDEAGIWQIQAKVIMPTGTWWSNTEEFKVYPNLST